MRPQKVSAPRDSNSRKKSGLITRPLPSVACTHGEVFPDGAVIELVQKAGILSLYVFDGERGTIAPEVRFRGRVFRPAAFWASIQRAVKFPEKCIAFGSTTKLFAAILELFVSHGFPEQVGLAATYFGLATWFPEVLAIAPCLLVTGPRFEASLLFQLLGCVVRRPLPLGEVTRRGLCSLPMDLSPTLLITAERIRGATLEMLRTSNHRYAFFPSKDGVKDLFCAKAVFCADAADSDILGEGALHVSLPPSCERLPILSDKHTEEFSREFQPRLLDYRCRNILHVRESQYDLIKLTSGTRILARVLGAPIVDAPTLRYGLIPLLLDHEEEKQALQWTDLRCVVTEALLHQCHKEPGARVHVGKITKTVNGILKGRGEATEREAREIGPVLRGLGLIEKRYTAGFAILLHSGVCRHIHQLAHGFGLLAMRKGEPRCAQCHSIVSGSNGRNGRASASKEKHG